MLKLIIIIIIIISRDRTYTRTCTVRSDYKKYFLRTCRNARSRRRLLIQRLGLYGNCKERKSVSSFSTRVHFTSNLAALLQRDGGIR